MPIQSYNTAWRDIVNTNTDAISQVDSGGTRRNVNAVWVYDGTSWKKVFNSSLYSTTTANKKRDMVIIGDSITWGYGLPMTKAHPYLVQQVINSKSGYVTSGWTARNITMDDTTYYGYNGGSIAYNELASFVIGTQYTIIDLGTTNWSVIGGAGTYIVGTVFTAIATYDGNLAHTGAATFDLKINTSASITGNNSGPFSGYPLTTPPRNGSWIDPCIRLSTAGTSFIGFSTSAHPNYIVVTAKGVGTLGVYEAGVLRGSIVLTSATTYVTTVIFTVTGTSYTIKLDSGTSADIVTIHPTNIYNGYANGYINIIVNGRNSYAVADYASVITDIKSTIINPVSDGAAVPIYVLAVGTVTLYDTSRQVTPAVFKTQLETLITGFNSGTNAGTVILTLPPKPAAGSGWSTPVGTTADDYNAKVIELANTYGLDYIDLYNGPFVDGTYTSGVGASGTSSATISYQADGIHPNATGAQQIANRFCCSLGL